jgi:hypothetical protein
MSEAALNPSSLAVEDAARLLKIDAAVVRRHIGAGLPTDDQGRIHLVDYVAWMVLRLHELSK